MPSTGFTGQGVVSKRGQAKILDKLLMRVSKRGQAKILDKLLMRGVPAEEGPVARIDSQHMGSGLVFWRGDCEWHRKGWLGHKFSVKVVG